MRKVAPRAFFMALWPDSLESYWWGGLVGSVPANRAIRPQKRPLGPLFALAPRAFFMALWPDSLESYWWGGLVGSVPANHQSGHKAIEKSLKVTS